MSISEHILRALAEDFIENEAISSEIYVYIDEIDPDLQRRLGKSAGGVVINIRFASKQELETLNREVSDTVT